MALPNKRLPPLPGLQAIENQLQVPTSPVGPSRQWTGSSDKQPIRETTMFTNTGGADYGTSWTRHLRSGVGGVSAQSLGNQRMDGGSGGGHQDFQGNMDANPLIGLNPYLEENVTSFSHGGNMPSIDGASSTGGGESWRYEQNKLPEQSSRLFPGNAEVLRLQEKARKDQFMRDSGLPHGVLSNNPQASPYTMKYNAEQERRRGKGGFISPLEGGRNPTYQYSEAMRLKNPWEQGYDNWYDQANKGMKMSEYKKGGKYPHNMFDPETGYKIVADNAAMHSKLNEQRFSHNKPMAAYGMKMKKYNQGGAMHQMPDRSMMAGATHPQSYNQGGFFQQQAHQSIQESHQANEQQALGQISGLLAKKLQGEMSPEQATSMASQMAAQSGLTNQPMANQPMANEGMRMRKRYTQGGRF